jgi:fibrillarin-like pre-rRNA processing protein
MIVLSKIFQVFEERKKKFIKLYTKNLVPGKTVYEEKIVKYKDGEYREWDHTRSKLAAAILKGATNIGIREKDIILYLGASTGTTVSHVSDMIGSKGILFAVEFAPRVTRELVFLSEERKNICPILADANKPETYANRICQADVIFQDIAQSHQAEIFVKNCKMHLKKGGYGLIAVKSRSIDISKKPKQIYKDVRAYLEKHLTIIDSRELDPFEKDHCMFICKKKK